MKYIALLFLLPSIAFGESVKVTNLTIESLAVDTVGSNKFVEVSPAQTGCFAVGQSRMLFNGVGENANAAYSTILMAFASGKRVEITHDGTTYCKIQNVKVLK